MIYDLQQPEAGGPSVIAGQMSPSGLLPCISVHRPWADWIMRGWKTIETRSHARFESLAGKTIGIHASKTWDSDAMRLARPYLTDEQFEQTYLILRDEKKNTGAVLGTVFVNEHRFLDPDDSAAALIDCETPCFGLLLRDPIKLACPFPVTGQQGIFHVQLPNE